MKKYVSTLLLLILTFFNAIYAQEAASAPTCPYIGSVNVITGQFNEAHTDLVLGGPKPFSLKRCFFGVENGLPEEQLAWHFNYPDILSSALTPLPEPAIQDAALKATKDPQNKLQELSITNVSGDKVYNSLRFIYDQTEETECCRVEASDGRTVHYYYRQTDMARDAPGFVIDRVIDAEGNETGYQYRVHPTERKMLLKRCDYPGGRYLESEYYEGRHNNVGGTLVTIEDPSRDPRIGRIKLQKEPHGPGNTPLITRRFFYGDDQTTILLANDQKTVYEYSKDQHVTAVKTYRAPSQGGTLYKVERLFWSPSKEGEERRLKAHTVEDGTGKTLISRTYDYDKHGNLIVEKLYGNISGAQSRSFEIDALGKPKNSHVDCSQTKYEYFQKDKNSPFYLVKKEEASGKVTRYLYDFATGRNTGMLICDGTAIRIRQFYVYNPEGLLIETISDDGSSEDCNNTTNVHERHIARFTPRKEQPALGMPEVIEESYVDLQSGCERLIKRVANHYSQQGKVIQQDFFDAEGNYVFSKFQNFDLAGRPLSKIEPEGNEYSCSYDASGNKISEEERRYYSPHKKISNHYDSANRLTATTETDANGQTLASTFRYDEMGNQIASSDRFGNETIYTYDEFKRLTKVIHPRVYDKDDNLIEPVVENRYDIFGNIILTIDPNGYRTQTVYNILGNPIQIFHPDGTQELFEYFLDGSLKKQVAKNGIATTYTRDFLGRVLTTELHAHSGESLGYTACTYNSFHKTSSIDPNGIETCYTYDGAGRQISAIKHSTSGSEKITFEYDSLGRLRVQKEWYGDGPSDYTATITERDLANHITEVRIENASGKILRLKTENLDEQELLQKSLENSAYLSIEHPYIHDRGQNSRQETTVDDQGTTITKTIDALGRCESIEKRNAFGQLFEETHMRYDPAGNKVKETRIIAHADGSASTFTVSWKYGPNNRLESIVEGEGLREQRTTVYQYNVLGQLETIIKPDQTRLVQSYNAQGLPSEITSSDGTIDTKYAYDQNGNVIQAVDRITGQATTRLYDSNNRLIEEQQGHGTVMRFNYDQRGRKSAVHLPDNSSIHYIFDAANLLAVERHDKSGKKLYTHRYLNHDLQGHILKAQFAGNIGEIHYQYGKQGQCTQIQTPFWEEQIFWNEAKEKQDLAPIEEIVFDTLGLQKNLYTYDASKQLIQETINNNDLSYKYDTLGNRLAKNETKYSINPVNEMVSDGSFHYSYDANGNLIKKENENSWCLYEYDALNRLIHVVFNHGKRINYSYDAFGRRLAKEVVCNNNEIKKENYLFDGDCEIGTLHSNGEISSLRILGEGFGAEIGAAVAMEFNEKLYIPIHDYTGSVRCLINASQGQIHEFYRYTAFGEESCYQSDGSAKTSQEVLNPWRFSSKRYDQDTGMIHYGKRDYLPSAGRWLTLDPLGHADGLNRFAFVHNNPKTNIDHYGLWSWKGFWNGFVDAIAACFKGIMNLGSKIFGTIRSETEYFEQIRPSMTTAFEKYFGRGFLTISGYYSQPLERGVYGQGEINDHVRITMINGLTNVRSYYRDTLELFNSSHGGINIHYIFRPTEGLCWDFVQAFLIKMGYVSPYARELAATWKGLIAEMGGVEGGGSIIHYCHSLGGSDTISAASLLTPEERRMIKVVSFGSATVVPDHLGFAAVTNFVSVRDGIYLSDPGGYFKEGYIKGQNNVIFLGSFLGIPLLDHPLATETYSNAIVNLGSQFMHMYAYSGGFF